MDASTPATELDHSRMTFGEHLDELRGRLLKALLGTLVLVGVATAFADTLVRIVIAPFQRVMRDIHANATLVQNSPTGSFVFYFKVSIIAGLIAAAPFWIYQVWAFIAAGLYKHERKWVFRFAPLSLVLFAGGVVFGYFVLLPVALEWLLTFASPDLIQNWIAINEYASLFTTLTLLLGIAFQLPVVMLGLAKAGIISSSGFRKKRKITILLIFIVAGLITPPDPVTQPLVAIPLTLLYELGIMLAWVAEGGKRAAIDWARWRRRGLIVIGLVVLVLVLRNRIADVFRGVEADRRAEAAINGTLPWVAIGSQILPAPPDSALQIDDDAAAPTLVVAGGGRLAVIRFVRSQEPAVVVESDSRTWRSLVWATGATVWNASLPDDLVMSAVLDPVVQALRTGNDETTRAARVIATAAMGGPLPAGDDAAAADALHAWLATRRDAPFVQPR